MWWLLHQFPAWELIPASVRARLMEAPLRVAPGRVFSEQILGEELPRAFLFSPKGRTSILQHVCYVQARPLQVTIGFHQGLFPQCSILCDAGAGWCCFAFIIFIKVSLELWSPAAPFISWKPVIASDFLFWQANHWTKTWGKEWFWGQLCPPRCSAFVFKATLLAVPCDTRRSAYIFFIMSLHLSTILRCGTIFQVFSVMGNEAEYILFIISTAAE